MLKCVVFPIHTLGPALNASLPLRVPSDSIGSVVRSPELGACELSGFDEIEKILTIGPRFGAT